MKQKHSSFRHQLIISYLMISMIPIVLILSVVFIKMYKGEQAAVSERLSSGAELIASQFNSLLDNMSFISINLISSPQVLAAAKGLGYENNTLLKEQEYYSRLKKEFCSYAIVSSPYRVTFFNGKGQYITSRNYNMEFSSHYRLPEEEIGKINWMEEVEGNYGQSILLPVQENAMPLSEGQFLTLARAVRDPGKNIGYLGVSVEMEQVNNILSIGTQMGAEVLFLSEEGEVLCHTEGFPVGGCYENGIWNLDGIRKDYFIADNYHKDNGIMTVLVYPQWKVMKEGVEGIWAFVAEAILFLVLTMVIIFHYSNKMTRPLQRLTRQMQEITIDGLDGHEGKEFHGYEEVEFLYTGYAKMQERLNVMIRNEITSQTLLMQERLNFLQSQINPHFLYNTLNVIGIMGMENENRRVYDACFKLSSLLRYSLGDNSEGTATIRQEMDNTTSYLELMKLRYEHRLDFEVSCEEKMEGLEVPRLILQPFVENVFEHVYSLEHRKVAVQVKGYCEGNGYRLMISDDGQGMKETEAARLMEEIRNSCRNRKLGGNGSGMGKIGIQNTMLRLTLYFKERFSYEIETGEGKGFLVSLFFEAF